MTPITRACSALRRWFRRWLRPIRPRLAIAPDLWEEMREELGRRGLHGRRESGAFLLGARRKGERRVTRIVYLDDLDPGCLTGNIHFRGAGYPRLWDICEAEGVRVIADVHTHPGPGVAQSATDRENPMIAQAGHVALILPACATRPVAAREVGVHEYLGERGWESWFGACAERALRIGSGR